VVTRPRDLRTGRSIWATRRALPVEHRPLANDVETDVLLIGGGITGAMVAQALVVSGLRVVIADKRGPAKGSTTATPSSYAPPFNVYRPSCSRFSRPCS
jgi:heterodisulfide reductase subunit A-like polyferredoxin